MSQRLLEISSHDHRLELAPDDLAQALQLLEEWGGPVPPAGELSVVFLSDGALAKIHGEYLADPSPTDVITFPGEPEMAFAGEICVSAERAWLEACRRGASFSEELSLYVVHGWLHLAGYDDQTDAARSTMREAETKAMRFLQTRRAPLTFRWRDGA